MVIKLFSQQRVEKAVAMFTGDTRDEKKRTETAQKMAAVHNRECHFYSTFSQLGLLPLPEVYYIEELHPEEQQSNGLILMQDLSESAYLDRIEEGLSRRKVESVVRHLATLHAHLLCLGEGEREELLSGVGSRVFYEEMMDNDGQGGAATMANILQRALEQAPEMTPHVKRLEKSLLSKKFLNLAIRDLPQQLGVPLLLAHGDLWTNNILWRKSDSGEELDEPAAIIDWQTPFPASPMFDIAGLVVGCCEAGVRRELEPCIPQLYYDAVCEKMGQKGKEPPFTVKELRPLYEILAVHRAKLLVSSIPHLTAVSLSTACLSLFVWDNSSGVG